MFSLTGMPRPFIRRSSRLALNAHRKIVMFGKLFIILCISLCACSSVANYEPKEGDVIFQSLPNGDIVDAIEGATESPYSHVGIVVKTEKGWFVREAIGDVHDTRLTKFLARGRNGKYDVYRLKKEYEGSISKIILATEKYIGLPYDIRYRMDDDFIYCSELVYKSFLDATGSKMGVLVSLGSLNWGKYESLIVEIEGGSVPVNRMMITPRDLAKARQLKLVHSGY